MSHTSGMFLAMNVTPSADGPNEGVRARSYSIEWMQPQTRFDGPWLGRERHLLRPQLPG
jgi:hypothetical protein